MSRSCLFIKDIKSPIFPSMAQIVRKDFYRTVHTIAFQPKNLSLGFLDITLTMDFTLLSLRFHSLSTNVFYKTLPSFSTYSTCACFIHRHVVGLWLVAAIT